MSKHLAKLSWDKEAKKDALYRNMKKEHKDAEVSYDHVPNDLDSRTAWHQRFDSRLAACTQDKKNQINPATKTLAMRTATTTTSEAKAQTSHPHATSSNLGNYSPAPMDLSAGKKKLTNKKRMRRVQQGLCLYCRGVEHMAKNCPSLAKNRTLQGAATNISAPATSVTASSNNTAQTPNTGYELQESDFTIEQPKN